jgi:hypothetical protein
MNSGTLFLMPSEQNRIPSAPIAVFAYNRPDHLRRTLASLRACTGFADSSVTVFVDGPRGAHDVEAVAQVAQVAATDLGEGADIRRSAQNRGLATSIVSGVEELVNRHGRVIVIEDDLELAPCFLEFMNRSLSRFEDDETVFQVSGHMFNVPDFSGRQEALLLPLTTTWGWATWARAWNTYDPAATGWERLLSDRALRRRFDVDGTYNYTEMMRRQMRGQSDSWGIRWYWSVFRQGGLTLFPPVTLVRNTGHDGSGTHGRGVVSSFSGIAAPLPKVAPSLPDTATPRPSDVRSVARAVWKENGGWKGWALGRIKGLLRL